jgi:hypothetical protein
MLSRSSFASRSIVGFLYRSSDRILPCTIPDIKSKVAALKELLGSCSSSFALHPRGAHHFSIRPRGDPKGRRFPRALGAYGKSHLGDVNARPTACPNGTFSGKSSQCGDVRPIFLKKPIHSRDRQSTPPNFRELRFSAIDRLHQEFASLIFEGRSEPGRAARNCGLVFRST